MTKEIRLQDGVGSKLEHDITEIRPGEYKRPALRRGHIVSDDAGVIAAEIGALLARGCDLLLVSGGMSVDPDDVTREGIARAGRRELAALGHGGLCRGCPERGYPRCAFGKGGA